MTVRSLLDVNVLIALFDQQHVFHQRARDWLTAEIEHGWASCPITQSGFARIISNQRYPGAVTTTQAIGMLANATADPHHEFWPDDLALTGSEIDRNYLLVPSQITDAYLLASAVAHGGRLVTFDQRIQLAAIPGAEPSQLVVL